MIPLIAGSDSTGLFFLQWNAGTGKPDIVYLTQCQPRVMTFSSDGGQFAWCDTTGLHIIDTVSRQEIRSLDLKRTFAMSFSPENDMLITWENYGQTKECPEGKDNLEIFNLSDGELIHHIIHRKMHGWKPQWFSGKDISAKLVGSNVHFFKGKDFQSVINRLHIDKLADFRLSPNSTGPLRIACFAKGAKGAPSFVRIFQYPNLKPDDQIANKSFFKADNADMLWNNRGSHLLVKASVDVDTTGQSYYGEQSLHFMSCSGESCIVSLSKKGPIYDAAWSPNSNEFCVVYGFQPAKASIFNLKCNSIFEFTPSAKNQCFYNPHGNLIVMAGFGNLRGNLEVWDMNTKKQVSQFQAPNSTYFEWCKDGSHFVTATTTPRLRVDNGYKLWNYVKGSIHENPYPKSDSLFEVTWQPDTSKEYPTPTAHEGMKQQTFSNGGTAKTAATAYIPPHARGKKKDSYVKQINQFNNGDIDSPVESSDPVSKAAMKNKKKRENKKNKQQSYNTSNISNEQQDALKMASYLLNEPEAPPSKPALDETEKKVKKLRKQLQAIEKLKQQQVQGKTLEKNQIEKLNNESKLIEELGKLTAK